MHEKPKPFKEEFIESLIENNNVFLQYYMQHFYCDYIPHNVFRKY